MTRFLSKCGPVCLLGTFLLIIPVDTSGQSRKTIDESPSKEPKAAAETPVEVRFNDNSVLKLTLREARIEFVTPYGKLQIPASEIRRLELGLRVPEDVSRKIESAIGELGNSQYRRREAASNILLGLREKAYPAVLNATKHADMEIANRAEELVKKFKETVPAELLQLREYDVITTDQSKIAGRVEPAVLKATTAQFGDVSLKLADVFVMTSRDGDLDPSGVAVAGPINLVQYQSDIGKSFAFKVTGSTGGSVWGTDLYTTDSALATAAVHAGLLSVGQTGIIKLTIVPAPQVFVGSSRNGVTSADFGQYPAAFRMRR